MTPDPEDATAAAADSRGPADLRVVLVQRASGLDPAENRAALDEVAGLADGSDLVVWPEAFARDFGPVDGALGPVAESLDGPFATRLDELAAQHGPALLAGMFETSTDPERPFNTLVLTQGNGVAPAAYRKIHLYDSFGYRESDRLGAGEVEPVVVEVGGWQVGLMTCYDLRFPELARALVDRGAEVLALPAAWVAGPGKVAHWTTLARARAIENVCWVVGVGQPGPRYTGHSLVVAPDGEVVVEAGEGPEVRRASLSHARLVEARRANPSLANRRMR